MSPGLESAIPSETEQMCNGSYHAEKMKPEPLLASQETQMNENGTTHVPIPPQGGKSSKICLTGLLSGLKLRAHRWAVSILALNFIQFIIIIALIAVSAKKPESCPACAACLVTACPDSWIGYLGKCYYFSEAEGNWTYSQSQCSALNASLAGIDTQQEMDFLMNHKGPSDHWIGLGREPNQTWMWTNSTEFNKWFPIAGGGLCAFLNRGDVSSSGCWRNARWICSKAAEKPAGRAK
ncbi:C-type lectin domain family 2 member D-like [Gopherus flavomarginatus]|uniref:C-type lectin domain family 2 member D-like n=1 Tax=Gopherus flavomarginatus TaxID=286002 RepID=UPI0021CBF317|nr:C-type lectin domain family 2 member D-like [Gopherus flavomarginatus]